MPEELQNDAPVCPPDPTPESAAQTEAPAKRGPGRPTIGKTSKKVQRQTRIRVREFRGRERAEKAILDAALVENNYLDTEPLREDEAKKLLREVRGVSAQWVDLIYDLALEVAQELKLPTNRFWWIHGCACTQASLKAGRPVLREDIRDGFVDGHLLSRCDLHATWDYSVSWREPLTFEGYLQLILDFKTDFFVANDVLGKDFTRCPAYQSFVDMMPKLDPLLLPRNYAQSQFRQFLDDARESSGGYAQRLLIASRASMKSWFVKTWLVQALTIVPDLRVWILTETFPLAESFVKEFRSIVEAAPGNRTRYQYLFPQYCIKPGEGVGEEFHSPMARLKFSVGLVASSMSGKGQTGFRSDFQVFDDPTSGDSISEDGINRTWDKYASTRKLLEAGGGLGSIVVMTPWSIEPPDLGAKLLKQNQEAIAEGDQTFLSYAIVPGFTVEPHAVEIAKKNLLDLKEEDVVINFPRFTWRYLRKEMQSARENNFRFFRSQVLTTYDHLVDDELRCTFTEESLRARTKPVAFFEPAITHQVMDTVLAVDTAWSTAKTADFSALALLKICRFDNKATAIVTGCPFGRWRLSELAVRIVEACHESNPTKVVIERSGSWESLRDEIARQAMLRGYLLPPIFWKSCAGANAIGAKALKIKATERMLADGTLWFTQFPGVEQVHAQYISFDGINNSRARHNDCPDAIASACDTYFPGLRQGVKSDEANAEEERQQADLTRRLNYERIYGSNLVPYSPGARAFEQSPDRRNTLWGIPGLRPVSPESGLPNTQPDKTVGFGFMRRRPPTA